MEIEAVVKGKRVKVLADFYGIIPVGAMGTLIETNDSAPYVDFDEHYEGCFEVNIYKNVRSMMVDELEEI